MIDYINKFIRKYFNIGKSLSQNSIKEILQEYSKYGIYYKIIPFIEEIHIFSNKKESEMIDSIIQELPDAEFIQLTLKNYHKEMLFSYDQVKRIIQKSEKEIWHFVLEQSPAEICSTVWESYDTTLLPYISNSMMKNMGLWTPGLFSNKIDKTFLYKLNMLSLDALEKIINSYRKNYSENSWLPDIISEQIVIIAGELSLHYLSGIEEAQHTFFHMNEQEFVQLSGVELKKRLFSRDSLHYLYFEYNEEWLKALEKLCKIAESWFGSNKPDSTDTLMLHIPLLYQLINQEEKAEKSLLNQLRKNRKIYTVGPLMACTIALAKTRDDTIQNSISAYLEDLYSIGRKSEFVNEYISLLDETIDYFSTYFEHIQNYVSIKSEAWKQYYLEKLESKLELGHEISGTTSILWIYQNLMEDDKFIKSLCMCKTKIQESINPLIDVEDFFTLSLNLFYDVSSHLGKCPRIIGNKLLYHLGQNKLLNPQYEVLYDEYYYDNVRHQALFDRFRKIQFELPSRQFTLWAKKVIHEYCQGETIITKKIITACAIISNNPVDYQGYNEDGLNRQVRNSLKDRLEYLGYSVGSQEQQGLGLTGKQSGEVDILIQKAGLPIAIYEGLLHRGNDYLKNHIEKAITRYNISGCKLVYIVEFIREKNFGSKWEMALNSIIEYTGTAVKEIDTGLNGIRMGDILFQWGDRGIGKMVFICVNCVVPQ